MNEPKAVELVIQQHPDLPQEQAETQLELLGDGYTDADGDAARQAAYKASAEGIIKPKYTQSSCKRNEEAASSQYCISLLSAFPADEVVVRFLLRVSVFLKRKLRKTRPAAPTANYFIQYCCFDVPPPTTGRCHAKGDTLTMPWWASRCSTNGMTTGGMLAVQRKKSSRLLT
jgi:hypothetical protein